MAHILRKMRLIFWKNMIIRKCHWLMTSLEIIVPVLIYILFASLKTLVPDIEKRYVNETQYYQFETSNMDTYRLKYLYFAPNNTGTLKIMNEVYANNMECSANKCEFLGFPTEESMINYIMDEKTEDYYDIVSVIFNNVHDKNLPKKLNYRIRSRQPYFDMKKLYSSQPPYQAYEFYFYMDLIKRLQVAIDTTFIKLQKPKSDFILGTQQAPDPPHWESFSLNVVFSAIIPICTIFSFMLVFVGVIQRVLEEKASGIKELMKMMGLESWMLWLGWYIHSMVTIAVSVTVITIVLKVPFSSDSGALIEYSDGFLLWLLLFFYCSSGVFFCFLVTTWFKKPMMGTSVGSVLWTVTAVPVLLINNQDGTSSFIRDLILIFPNSCITFGFKTLYEFENNEIGLQWSNLYSMPNEFYTYTTIGKIMLFLIIDSFIFLFLTWYIDNINPGDYGVRRPFNFLFMKSYWCAKVEDVTSSTDSDEEVFQGEIEQAPANSEVGIKIRDLQKEFKKKKAVNGLSFDIYTNQITILLGHNGAGKTTTMNIVTGMIAPTRGTVHVDGYSVLTNMDKVRESLGLCPQHNMQFPDLSVIQHLIFFGMLKGKSKSESEQEGIEFLRKLCMSDKANKKARELSGGMRRRLSLGMALVGNTKVLMLDEPTSGMDPEARREIWDLLLSMRGSRTILITTHYMEEADILGDRIAIMHSGQLMCYGTSMFLKKHYGTGYVLSVLLTGKVDIKPITNTIVKYVPNVTIKNMTVGSIKFELPTSDTSALSKVFLDLESKKTELGIASFGISITTMDDVFLKVGKLADKTYNENSLPSETTSETSLITAPETHIPVEKYNAGFHLILQQFWALAVKRVLYYQHAWLLFIIAILLPLLSEIVTILTNQSLGSESNVTRVFKIGDYPDALSYYSVDKAYPNINKIYKTVVQEQNSVSALTDSVSEAIVKMGIEEPMRVHSKVVTAAEFNSTEGKLVANAIYGRFALHGLPISINLVTNTLLRYFMQDDAYSITTSYNPLPNVFNIGLAVTSANWIFFYPLGLILLIAILLGFHNAERLSGIKHLQIMSGISRIMYWFNNYLIDMIIFLFVTMCSVIIILLMDPTLSPSITLQAITALTILFGLANFPFSYFFHYRPTAGSVVTFMIWCQIICGIILPNVIIVWEKFPEEQKCLREVLSHIFLLFPNYAFAYGLNMLVSHAVDIHEWDSKTENKKLFDCRIPSSHVCCNANSQECKDFYSYYAGDHSISKPLLFLTGEIFLYFIIFLFVDYGLLRKYFDKVIDLVKGVSVDTQIRDLDPDVSDEQNRVSGQINESRNSPSHSRSDILLVSNLRKWFGNFHAVKGLNFGVKQSECFGLLGINGAGKTTTFKMLTGEIFVSTGIAQLLNYSLSQNKSKFLNQIGYCPQFDAFNFNLSTRQMLTFFAEVRGIPQNQIKHQVDKWLNKFDIMKYENIQCSKMSGGNKRKLSTAIALIGDPPLIMLDEPTSGVDPVARRNLWGILGVLRKSGQSIVLTSHSMDECEALCDRLAIMVDGQMKCIGGIQYLKNKFGQGFTVMIKLRNITTVHEGGDEVSFTSDTNRLKQTIEQKYACVLKDEHKAMLMYHITDGSATLGEIFQFMEEVKNKQMIVEDFTVSDTSLEQVFLSFAKEKLAAKDKATNNVV